jgi:glycosidase
LNNRRTRRPFVARLLGCCAVVASLSGLLTTPVLAQKPTRPWSDDVLYFVLLDRFADGDPKNNRDVDLRNPGGFHGGDIDGLIGRLDDLAELGITALWINPVIKNIPGFVPSGRDFGHYAHHGYWADDFSQMDDRFGTPDDLKRLVDEAHKRGIKVLLDVVYNHAGYGASYTKQSDASQILRMEERGTCGPDGDDIIGCVAGLPDFKTERPDVAKWLIETQIPLAKSSGIDGYRLDTVKHMLPEFWQMHKEIVSRELGSDFFLLAEYFGADLNVVDPYFEKDVWNSALDFTFKGETLGFVQGRGRIAAYSRYLQKRHKVRPGYLMSHYLSSHDVPMALGELGGDVPRFRLMAAMQMASLGMPQIYYGEEVARPGLDWPDNRLDMPWGKQNILPGKGKARDDSLRDYYKALIAARKANRALSVGTYTELSVAGDVLVFQRSLADGSNTVVVAANRAEQPQTVTVKLPADWVGKPITDAITGKPAGTGAAEFPLTVDPLTALYLVVR